MPEMKYYIKYGNWKPGIQGPEDMKKAMEKWIKVAEEAGLKVVFWGSSLGVSESSLCVYKGTPESFLKLPFGDAPYTNSRTNVIITF
jgi:hypothetical protein